MWVGGRGTQRGGWNLRYLDGSHHLGILFCLDVISEKPLALFIFNKWKPLALFIFNKWKPLALFIFNKWKPLALFIFNKWKPLALFIFNKWKPLALFIFNKWKNRYSCWTRWVVKHTQLVPLTELWLAPLQLERATNAAIFLVAPGLASLLFKIDSDATSAASIFTNFKRCANR